MTSVSSPQLQYDSVFSAGQLNEKEGPTATYGRQNASTDKNGIERASLKQH